MSEASYTATHNQAAARWNRGEFLAASRVWDEAWQAMGADEGPGGPDDPTPPPPVAYLFRGLIRLAAGMQRWSEGRYTPAMKLLAMGLSDLEGARDVDTPLNTFAILEATKRFVAQLEKLGEDAAEQAAPLVPVFEILPLL